MSAAVKFQVQETTISDVHAAYEARALTARQLVEMYLERIELTTRKVRA